MTQYGIATSANTIFHAVRLDVVPTRRVTLKERQRLDHIAGKEYGDAGLWWVIAAASGIGWALQAPPGTVLNIPIDIGTIRKLVG